MRAGKALPDALQLAAKRCAVACHRRPSIDWSLTQIEPDGDDLGERFIGEPEPSTAEINLRRRWLLMSVLRRC
jgi:hypothetical protein